MQDDNYYFSLFRNALKSNAKSSKLSNSIDNDEVHESFRIALDILTKAEVNVHLRFLAAHVVWHFLRSARGSSELLSAIYSSVLPGTKLVLDVLLPSLWPDFSSGDGSVDCGDRRLTNVDLSIFNGFINVCSDSSTAFVGFISPTIFRSLDNERGATVLDPYQHLYVLNNGLQKLTKIDRLGASIDGRRISNSDRLRLLHEIETKIVRRYWDSRFSGCAELALDCYRAALSGLDKAAVDVAGLIIRYADLRRYAWHLRGKYRMLAVLLEFVEVEELLTCEDQLLESLKAGLAATHVAPFSTIVYKTVLNVFCLKGRDRVDGNLKRWVLSVEDALLSKNRLVAMHASKYWVPAISKFVPEGCQWLSCSLEPSAPADFRGLGDEEVQSTAIMDSLCRVDWSVGNGLDGNNRGHQHQASWRLWAFLLVQRHARKWHRNVVTMEETEYDKLRNLESDEVRLETFAILLDMSGKYESLSKDQYRVASSFLLDNLIIADSSFRRRLLATYSKWFRASVDFFSKLVSNSTADQRVEEFRHFVVELVLIRFVDNLFPGANYQRLTTTLAILQSTLDCLKSKVIEHLWSILEVDQAINGSRDFGLQLLRCLQNSSDEVRRRSSFLLRTHSKFPFHPPLVDTAAIKNLCSAVCVLCRSPKAIDCETAAILSELIARKLLLDGKYSIRLDNAGNLVEVVNGDERETSTERQLFADIVDIMQSDFEKLRTDLRTAAADSPLHGWCLALATMMEVFQSSNEYATAFPSTMRVRLLDLGCQMMDFMLNALGSPAEGLCPSLAEMDDAIISSSIDTLDNDDEDSSIPLDQQLVLACCWLNIKAFANILEKLASYALLCDADPVSPVRRIGLTLFDAMSRTRHFGALEGCSLAFSKYLRSCLSFGKVQVQEIPVELLQKVLDHVANPKRVSITRRAVGFPIMIECIAAAGWAMRKLHFLEVAFQRLLSISDRDSTQLAPQDEKSDVDVVRAMHCLRLLVRSSSLDLAVLSYVGSCYRLAVLHFSSPVWSIRNSAMLLLSSILWRLFGRREVKQDDEDSIHAENRMDLVEFCADFLDIWRFFCVTLKAVASEASVSVNSRLFALLLFAQNLVLTDIGDWPELVRDANDVVTILIDLLFRIPDARLKRIISEILANFLPNSYHKRRQFSMALYQHLLDKNGSQLPLNDQMALIFLVDALKLNSCADVAIGNRVEKINTGLDEDDVVEACRRLKSQFLVQSDGDNVGVDRQLLERSVAGSLGESAQCLALPVLAKSVSKEVTRGDDASSTRIHESKRADQLITQIQSFARCRSESRRLAAACSIRVVRRFSTEVTECGDQQYRLFSICRPLLSDEDALVRQIAARCCSQDADAVPLDPVSCLRAFFDESVLLAQSCQSIVDEMLEIGSDHINIATLSRLIITDGIDTGSNFLFVQQDFNIYKEEFFHLQLFSESLRRRRLLDDLENLHFHPPPEELVNLCVATLKKLNDDVRFRRRNEEKIFLIAMRLLLRYRLSRSEETDKSTGLLRSVVSEIFGDCSNFLER